MIEQVTLTLPKIGCQGRMKKVAAVLGMINGVEVTKTSVPSKTVSLRYEANHTDIVQIEAALQTIGHVIDTQEVAGESSSFSLA